MSHHQVITNHRFFKSELIIDGWLVVSFYGLLHKRRCKKNIDKCICKCNEMIRNETMDSWRQQQELEEREEYETNLGHTIKDRSFRNDRKENESIISELGESVGRGNESLPFGNF